MISKDWILWAGMLVACGCRAPQSTFCASTNSIKMPCETASSAARASHQARQHRADCDACAECEPVLDGVTLEPVPDRLISAEPASAEVVVDGLVPHPDAKVASFEPEAIGYLRLRQVIESVYASFPALEVAIREAEIAAGKETAAWGEFDFKVKAESISAPMGYYKNYRNLLKMEQGLLPGGNVFGQYRSGDGDFPVWYGERETNEGGEFKLGFISPVLRDRSIDQRRSDLFQATLRRQQVDPMVQSQLLEFTYAAADAYWSWVAAGLSLDAQQELLRVTVERNRVYEERVKAGDLAQIELVQNERLIAAREAKVIEARRKLQQSAIKLSLFFRDSAGVPAIVPESAKRSEFPQASLPNSQELEQDIQRALQARPELRELDFLREQAKIDLEYGQNLRMPGLNVVLEASKDVGAAASPKGDKTPFELEAGFLFDVPLQRRKADGKIREAEGKLGQIAAKRRFMENKVTVQVQDAMSALVNAYERVGRARENLRLAQQLEKAERDRFEAQDSDLLRVAIQETAEIEAALSLVEVQAEYFKAEAAYRASLGLDPMQIPDEF